MNQGFLKEPKDQHCLQHHCPIVRVEHFFKNIVCYSIILQSLSIEVIFYILTISQEEISFGSSHQYYMYEIIDILKNNLKVIIFSSNIFLFEGTLWP